MEQGFEGERGSRRDEARLDEAGARTDIVRAAAPSSAQAGDTHARYLAELSAYPKLDAEQELALALEIEACEQALWAALLVPAALPLASKVLGRDGDPPEGWAAFCARARGGELAPDEVLAMAAHLRAWDETREHRLALERELLAWCRERPDQASLEALIMQRRRAYQRATQRMVTSNLRLVLAVAKRYGSRSFMSPADFVQEGNLGLLRAVVRFDRRHGVRFSTYAVWWIRHALNRALSDRGRLVRVPVRVLDDVRRLARARTALLAREGEQAPSAERLATEAGIPLDRLAPLLEQNVGGACVSLDRKVGEDGQTTMLDGLAAESTDVGAELDAVAWKERARPMLEQLTPVEADVLRHRFGLDDGEELTLREIGEKYGLTRERIRQLQEQGLGKLRRALFAETEGGTAA
jgi:RNA polymerase primary sigma factor